MSRLSAHAAPKDDDAGLAPRVTVILTPEIHFNFLRCCDVATEPDGDWRYIVGSLSSVGAPMRTCHLVVATAVAITVATASAQARETVSFNAPGYSAGTIVIRTNERRLYLVLGNGQAIRYTVGVG